MLLKITQKIESDAWDYSDNIRFRHNIMTTLPMHGEWSSYKIAEVFEKSLDCESLRIQDLGISGKDIDSNDGPIGGLKWLYGREETYTNEIKPIWERFGANLASAWGVDIGEVESSLCKWHKMMTGKYYIGHDIHELIELKEILPEAIYNRMMCRLYKPGLWKNQMGVQTKAKVAYRDSGKLWYNVEYAQKLPEIDVYEIMLKSFE
jgi:hypothetical protein